MASSRSISNGTVWYHTGRFHRSIPSLQWTLFPSTKSTKRVEGERKKWKARGIGCKPWIEGTSRYCRTFRTGSWRRPDIVSNSSSESDWTGKTLEWSDFHLTSYLCVGKVRLKKTVDATIESFVFTFSFFVSFRYHFSPALVFSVFLLSLCFHDPRSFSLWRYSDRRPVMARDFRT